MRSVLYKIVHTFYAVIVAMAAGAVINIILLFTLAFLFVSSGGDKWVGFYFSNDGVYFLSGVFLVACLIYPFTRKLKIVMPG